MNELLLNFFNYAQRWKLMSFKLALVEVLRTYPSTFALHNRFTGYIVIFKPSLRYVILLLHYGVYILRFLHWLCVKYMYERHIVERKRGGYRTVIYYRYDSFVISKHAYYRCRGQMRWMYSYQITQNSSISFTQRCRKLLAQKFKNIIYDHQHIYIFHHSFWGNKFYCQMGCLSNCHHDY